jgi:uncharacterized membrane protein
MDDDDSAEETPAHHVETGVQRMAELHAEYARDMTAVQRRLSMLAGALARPTSLVAAGAVTLAWIGGNLAAPAVGHAAVDPPPFPLLQCAASVTALFIALLILGAQRKEEELGRRRAQLTLQLALLTEQKIAKVIGLMQEQRRENPMLPDSHDPEAEDMSQPADPGQVMDRIIETHEGEAQAAGSREAERRAKG